jgi:hypothetical protein
MQETPEALQLLFHLELVHRAQYLVVTFKGKDNGPLCFLEIPVDVTQQPVLGTVLQYKTSVKRKPVTKHEFDEPRLVPVKQSKVDAESCPHLIVLHVFVFCEVLPDRFACGHVGEAQVRGADFLFAHLSLENEPAALAQRGIYFRRIIGIVGFAHMH